MYRNVEISNKYTWQEISLQSGKEQAVAHSNREFEASFEMTINNTMTINSSVKVDSGMINVTLYRFVLDVKVNCVNNFL